MSQNKDLITATARGYIISWKRHVNDWNEIYNLSNNKPKKKIFYKPNKFQIDVVNKVVKSSVDKPRLTNSDLSIRLTLLFHSDIA